MKSYKNQITLHRWLVYFVVKIVCKKLHIAKYVIGGSYRRGKRWINDIDLLVPVSSESEADGIKIALSQMGWSCINSETEFVFRNQFVKTVNNRTIVLDLFFSMPETWGNCLLFVTGSKHFNDEIRRKLIKLGYHWDNPRYFTSIFCGKKISFSNERAVFNFLNMRYRRPSKRDRV